MFYYKILLDVQRDYSFVGIGQAYSDITSRAKRMAFQYGMATAYDYLGSPAYLELTLDNSDGAFLLEQPSAAYYGKVRRGTMVRVQMSTDGSTWTNMTTLKIQEIMPVFVFDGSHEVTLKCSDIMSDFLNKDFVAPLQTNVTTDAVLTKAHTGAAAIWPYESYYQFIGHTSIGDGRAPFYGADWIDFETGETTFPFYGDNLDRGQGTKLQQYIKDAVQAEIFGMYFFSPRSETFKFLSRYHASDTAVSWNVTSSIMDAPKYTYGRDLVNDFALAYYPRAIGAEGTVLYESDNLPITLAALETKRIVVRYRDPANETASVGALEIIEPVRGTDIIANTQSDGSGNTVGARLVVTIIKGASSSEIILSNRRNKPTYITTLQLRGTPLTTYNREQVFAINDDSIFGDGADETTGNDRKSGFENIYAISNADFAQAYANYKVSAFGQPQQVIEKLVIPVNPSDLDTQAKVLSKTVGDVINVVDSYTGHDMDYMIVGEAHTASPNTYLHTVTYTLRPTNRASLFTLDESTYGGGASFSF